MSDAIVAPDLWLGTTLGEVVTQTGGVLQTGPFGSQLHASDYSIAGTPLIMPTNLGDNLIREDGIARVSAAHAARLRRHALRAGDIVFGRRGDVGRRSIVRQREAGWLCGTGCLAAKFGPRRENVNPEFVAVYLGLPAVQAWLLDNAVGGTMPNLNTSILGSTPLRMPTRATQDAVIAALNDVSSLLAGLKHVIAKKQAIKQSMMQQLLTGRTRLSGYVKPWTSTSVGTLARVTGGGTPSTRVPDFWNGDIPWFTPAEILASGSGLVSRSERTITREGLASSSAIVLPPGTVLVTSRASIGNCAVAEVPVTTNQGFASMIPNDLRSTWFLYYWVQQNRSALESRAAGSTFLEISASKVVSIPLERPSVEEQEAIGRAIRDCDLELEVVTQRLAKARAIKAGMMQQLLSGQVRLPVETLS